MRCVACNAPITISKRRKVVENNLPDMEEDLCPACLSAAEEALMNSFDKAHVETLERYCKEPWGTGENDKLADLFDVISPVDSLD